MSTESARKAAEEILEYTGLELPRTRDGIQAIIERHFPERLQVISESAACQTVAPPPLSLLTRLRVAGGNLRMNLKDAAMMYPEHFNIPGLEQLLAEYEAINAEVVAFECGAAPAVSTPNSNPEDEFAPKGRVIPDLRKREHLCEWQAASTPRCPVCESADLVVSPIGDTLRVECACGRNWSAMHPANLNFFRQFFQPAPAPPPELLIEALRFAVEAFGPIDADMQKLADRYDSGGEPEYPNDPLHDMARSIQHHILGVKIGLEEKLGGDPMVGLKKLNALAPAAPSPQGESK